MKLGGVWCMKKTFDKQSDLIPCNLYVLKHKDNDVAMVQVNLYSGEIEYVLEVYLPEKLPIGCDENNMQSLIEWWTSRAIPDSRRGIQQALRKLNETTNLTLMLHSYGLSLTDHYWLQPIGIEEYWKERNFFENDFSDELGSLLTDSEKIDIDTNISKFSPSSSVNGEMKKKWVIDNGIRYLMKVNINDYGQQSINEYIATKLHEKLGWSNYVSYKMGTVVIEGKAVPCSLNPLFTTTELEFVSAYQLIKDVKIPNDSNEYEEIIKQAVSYGIEECEVREHLEYTILTDFILSNTDRHYNNFGFLYNSEQQKFISMAPIFDTGNSLFYNRDVIPGGSNLLDISVTSFKKKEVDMLQYITNRKMIDLDNLQGFYLEVEELLKTYTNMPEKRAKQIANTIKQKIEYLQLFQEGKKIWKKEKYW